MHGTDARPNHLATSIRLPRSDNRPTERSGKEQMAAAALGPWALPVSDRKHTALNFDWPAEATTIKEPTWM